MFIEDNLLIKIFLKSFVFLFFNLHVFHSMQKRPTFFFNHYNRELAKLSFWKMCPGAIKHEADFSILLNNYFL